MLIFLKTLVCSLNTTVENPTEFDIDMRSKFSTEDINEIIDNLLQESVSSNYIMTDLDFFYINELSKSFEQDFKTNSAYTKFFDIFDKLKIDNQKIRYEREEMFIPEEIKTLVIKRYKISLIISIKLIKNINVDHSDLISNLECIKENITWDNLSDINAILMAISSSKIYLFDSPYLSIENYQNTEEFRIIESVIRKSELVNFENLGLKDKISYIKINSTISAKDLFKSNIGIKKIRNYLFYQISTIPEYVDRFTYLRSILAYLYDEKSLNKDYITLVKVIIYFRNMKFNSCITPDIALFGQRIIILAVICGMSQSDQKICPFDYIICKLYNLRQTINENSISMYKYIFAYSGIIPYLIKDFRQNQYFDFTLQNKRYKNIETLKLIVYFNLSFTNKLLIDNLK